MATIQLKYPISVNDEPVSELVFPERVKLKHLKAMDSAGGEVGKMAALIGSMASLPLSAVDQIDAEDFAAIGEVLGGFLGKLPATGRM